MRDPADVIAETLHENVVQGMTVEQWREKATRVIEALRREYGTTIAPVTTSVKPEGKPHTTYVTTRKKRVIPVPAAEEGEA